MADQISGKRHEHVDNHQNWGTYVPRRAAAVTVDRAVNGVDDETGSFDLHGGNNMDDSSSCRGDGCRSATGDVG